MKNQHFAAKSLAFTVHRYNEYNYNYTSVTVTSFRFNNCQLMKHKIINMCQSLCTNEGINMTVLLTRLTYYINH